MARTRTRTPTPQHASGRGEPPVALGGTNGIISASVGVNELRFRGFQSTMHVSTYVRTVLSEAEVLRLVSVDPSPRKCHTACHCSRLPMMIVRDKLCFVLSTSWRTAGWSSTPRLATTTTTAIAGTTRTTLAFSKQTATTRMSSNSALGAWPSPQAFNALPVSSRSKAYCDYGDEGKMTWKPHEEPLKVGGW